MCRMALEFFLDGSSGGSSPVVRHYRDFLTPKSICFASSCIFSKKGGRSSGGGSMVLEETNLVFLGTTSNLL